MKIRANLAGWAAAIALAGSSASASSRRPAITIRVVNEGGVEAGTLSVARNEALRIFARAGIELVWLDCGVGRIQWGSGDPCQRDRGPAEFWFRIVTRRPSATTPDVLGFTELDDTRDLRSAGVYYPCVMGLSKKWRVGAGEILGAAVAHEVGHLILGARSHTARGIMQAHWTGAEFVQIGLGELSFTPAQARMLDERITFLMNSPSLATQTPPAPLQSTSQPLRVGARPPYGWTPSVGCA